MRRLLALGVGAAASTTSLATAQPPSHPHRLAPSPPASTSTGRGSSSTHETGPRADLSAAEPPLVGWHAASSEPLPRDANGRPMLSLRTLNHRESLTLAASTDDGGFAAADLDRAAHLLRAAGGEEHPIDPRTLGLVYRIQTHFGVPELRVVSGYRVPRPRSRSNHGKGRAIDLVVPGVPDEEVAAYVRELGFVGVGVYPASQFVHVDIRPRSYFWVDFSAPHRKNRERGILGDLAARSDAAARAGGRASVEPFAVRSNVDLALGDAGALPSATSEDEDEEEN